MIFIPALWSEDWARKKIMSVHAFLAFLGQLRFWMDTFWIARWNGLKILIPKHMWKSKIRPLELKKDKKSRKYLFLETPCMYILCTRLHTSVPLSERAEGCFWQACHAVFLKETKIRHFRQREKLFPFEQKSSLPSRRNIGGILLLGILQSLNRSI